MAIINQVVSGGGSAPAHYIEKTVGANGKLVGVSTIINMSGVTDVGDYGLYYAYYNNIYISGPVDLSSLTTVSGEYGCGYMFYACRGLTSVDLSSLTTISGIQGCSSMFSGCSGLTSVDLSSLTTISWIQGCSSMFYECTGLTSVDLSSLTTVSGEHGCSNMFYGCGGLTSVDLSSFTTLSGTQGCSSMFSGCRGLTSVDLLSLTTVSGAQCCVYMFRGCTNLTSLSFPSITPNSFGSNTNQFNNMCFNSPNVTLHFPSNTQAKVETLAGYSSAFGATSGTVLFDLPATNTLTGADSVTYTRNPKYDTATALAWKVGAYGTTDFTPAYYTSGTTDPAVGDTIYSDAACTTAVTTISAIA